MHQTRLLEHCLRCDFSSSSMILGMNWGQTIRGQPFTVLSGKYLLA